MGYEIAHSAVVAQHLLGSAREQTFQFVAGLMRIDGRPVTVAPGVTDAPFSRTLRLCLSVLKIHKSSAHAHEVWKSLFEDERAHGHDEVIAVARAGSLPEKPLLNSLLNWQHRWRVYQREVFSSLRHDWIDQIDLHDADKADMEPGKRLVTGPVFTDWPHRLINDDYWSKIVSPMKGMPDLPLDDVWTELHLTAPSQSPRMGTSPFSGRPFSFQDSSPAIDEVTAVSPERVVEAITRPTLVLGRPGSGKTTFLKWVALSCVTNDRSRFLLPLFVPLRKYVIARQAAQRRGDGNLSLLRFFLGACGVTNVAQVELWEEYFRVLSSAPQQGGRQPRVLWLLDGWDETPEQAEAELCAELEEAGNLFPMIIASRLMARELPFLIESRYEIGRLSSESRRSLVQRWFQAMERPRQAPRILEELERNLDLNRMSGNPFLLTLLCCIAFDPKSDEIHQLPGARGEIYDKALDAIFLECEEKLKRPIFTPEKVGKIQEFALWLMDEVEGAPRFMFEKELVLMGSHDPVLFAQLLKSSRLITQVYADYEAFQFLHTTFQEYLAACAFVRRLNTIGSAPDALAEQLSKRFHQPIWVETLRMVAGLADRNDSLRSSFWNGLKSLLESSDLYGQTERRLAYLLAELRPTDGGRSLLGTDLRDRLWPQIEAAATTYQLAMDNLADAFIELDPNDYRRRLSDAMQRVPQPARINLLRSLRRLPPSADDGGLFHQLFDDEEAVAAVAGYAYSSASRALLERIREVVRDPAASLRNRIRALKFLVRGDDAHIEGDLIAMLRQSGPDDWDVEVARALGQLGSPRAISALIGHLRFVQTTPSSDRLREEVVRSIAACEAPYARQWLEHEILATGVGDPALGPLIDSYASQPIHDEWSEWLYDVFVYSSVEGNRLAALRALRASTWHEVPRLVCQLVRPEKDPFRPTALEILEQSGTIETGWHLFGTAKSPDCQDPVELVIGGVRIAHRCRHLATATVLLGEAERQLLWYVEHGDAGEAHRASNEAWRVGPSMIPVLLQRMRQPPSPSVRRAAASSLGKLGATEALGDFESSLRDADRTWREHAQADPDPAFLPIAVKAILEINPARLLLYKNEASEHALRKYSFDTGSWVFDNHIVTSDGKVLTPDGVQGLETSGDRFSGAEVQSAATGNPVQFVPPRPDVLLVTVNEHETRAVLDEFEAAIDARARPVPREGRVYRNLGRINDTLVYHALSEMGSGSAGAMQQTVDKAIRALDPGAVIAIGVAFGVNEKKQAIGDILLSTQLRPYDLQRMGSEIILRGDRPHATPRLINHFNGFGQTAWQGAKVISGAILTGDKLIDNIDYRNLLLALEKEAVGGEMEGAGLYVACYEHKVDWIVIKAICDWGDGKKAKNKTARQKKAAKNSVQFFVQALQNAPLKYHR